MIKKIWLVLAETMRGFLRDHCYLNALALTYSCLLSIVPILAVAFGMAKGFGVESNFETELLKFFPEHKEVVEQFVSFAYSTLEQVRGGLIAGVGALVLFLLVFSLFWCIETALNRIWKVKKERPFIRKIPDYLAMMLLCPLLFVVGSSLFFFLSTPLSQALDERWIYGATCFLLIWTFFALLYLYMPNTRVSIRYGLISSFLVAICFQFMQWLFLAFQIGVSQYHAIYGSFAVIPVFMIWLQVSWVLVFIGAELAYHLEQICPLKIAFRQKVYSPTELGIYLSHQLIATFTNHSNALSLYQIAREMGVSLETVKALMERLVFADLFVLFRSDKYGEYYQPACPLEEITLKKVKDALETPLENQIFANPTPSLEKISDTLALLNQEMDLIQINQPLTDFGLSLFKKEV